MTSIAGMQEVVEAPESREERPRSPEPRALSAAPVVAATLGMFALALLVMPHAPGMGDSAEMTLALALAGIPHPTGYPLYTLIGHAFALALHALGVSWTVAAAVWSAAGAAVAAGAITRLVQHLDAVLEDQDRRAGRDPLPALARGAAIALPVTMLAFHPVWVQASTVAEVYSWNQALLALAAAFAIGRMRALGRIDRPRRAWPAAADVRLAGAVDAATTFGPARGAADLRDAALWGLLCGTCAAHHLTSGLFILPLSLALVASYALAGRWRWPMAVAALAVSAVPLLSYLWIPWRAAHPAAFQWPTGPSARALWMHVSGAAYGYYLGHFAPGVREWFLIRWTVLPILLPGLMLGALMVRRVETLPVRWGLMALLIGGALQVAFVTRYGVADPAMYFLPPLMAGLLVLTPCTRLLARRTSARLAGIAALGLAVAFAGLSIPHVLADRARLARVDAEFRAAWARIPFQRGIVLWRDDHYQRFKMLQILEGQRPELYIESPDMLIWPARRRAFTAFFGFDPLANVVLDTPEDIGRIPTAIRRKTKLPMLLLPDYHEPPRH